ncbi:MAG: putative metalloprotease CJM1_0395 family protein [bacterium]|nr:putative metalloprotease CJM1_0395 family protein [bacterium]
MFDITEISPLPAIAPVSGYESPRSNVAFVNPLPENRAFPVIVDQVELSPEGLALSQQEPTEAASATEERAQSPLAVQPALDNAAREAKSTRQQSSTENVNHPSYNQSLIKPTENVEGEQSKQQDTNGKKSKDSAKDEAGTTAKRPDGKPLTDSDQQKITKLQMRDAEVKAHEQAHLAAAGNLASGGANFEYEKGPDGKAYAVGGDVQISTGGGNTPEERLRIANQVIRAALAPANPSSQDRAVASEAMGNAAEARAEISQKTISQPANKSTDESAKALEQSPESNTADPTKVKPLAPKKPESSGTQPSGKRESPNSISSSVTEPSSVIRSIVDHDDKLSPSSESISQQSVLPKTDTKNQPDSIAPLFPDNDTTSHDSANAKAVAGLIRRSSLDSDSLLPAKPAVLAYESHQMLFTDGNTRGLLTLFA